MNKQYTSISGWFYLFTLLLAATLIYIGITCSHMDCALIKLAENLGLGLFSSLFVALMIDVASTRIERKRDKEKANELLAQYRGAFLDMRDAVLEIVEEEGLNDGDKRTFEQWLAYVIKSSSIPESEVGGFDSTWPLFYSIQKIQSASEKLIIILQNNMENKFITSGYRNHVKRINHEAAHIIRGWEREEDNISRIKATILNQFLPLFLENNPEYRCYYETPYCESHWYWET